jgi:hypothetical protein
MADNALVLRIHAHTFARDPDKICAPRFKPSRQPLPVFGQLLQDFENVGSANDAVVDVIDRFEAKYEIAKRIATVQVLKRPKTALRQRNIDQAVKGSSVGRLSSFSKDLGNRVV